jgi:microcystin-dependent protein
MVGFNFQPSGWQLCNGQLLSISNYDTLFNLIGTTYGGDGQNTFALPNLLGRSPVHTGGSLSYVGGQSGGVETVTLTTAQLPSPIGNYMAGSSLGQYAPTPATGSANMLGSIGGGQPHDNLMPYQTVNFIISLYGVYPSRS